MTADSGAAMKRGEVELFVEEAPFAQDLECPACAEQFKELVTENIGASTCPECNTWIRYVRSRSEGSTEDETEQTELVTDGGRDVSETGMQHCLDLFAGLGGFSAAFEDSPNWDVTTVEIEEEFAPDIQADVLDLRPGDLPDADVVLASPPCTAFSMAAHGTHLDGDGRPVSEWGRESLALVHHTVGLIKAIDPDYWILENPMGGMRRQLGDPDAHVWWCQYGSSRAKPTDLWGRLPPSFDARRCHRENPSCDHERAPRSSNRGTDASGQSAAERAEIPYGLSEVILEAVESPEPEQQLITEVA